MNKVKEIIQMTSIFEAHREALTAIAKDGVLRTRDITKYSEENGLGWDLYNEIRDGALPRIKKGSYNIAAVATVHTMPAPRPIADAVAEVVTESSKVASTCFVPAKDKTYVKFGIYKDVELVISSGEFLPMYVVGESGNGKTMSIEQACANLNRPYDIISIDSETCYEQLIAKTGLKDGNTVTEYGVIARAMMDGAVVLLDEIDRGVAKNLMCIQAVLNGDPLVIKETGETIVAKPGFMIIATGNTKAQGDMSGRFISAEVLDEAFLERFPITLEQGYPTESVETRILERNGLDSSVAAVLAKWAASTRTTYEAGGIDNFITTRRLCHIAGNFKVFADMERSVKLACGRFDEDTCNAMIELYKALESKGVAIESGDDF